VVDSTKVSATLFSDIAPSGAVLKSSFSKTTTVTNTAAIIPIDGTIPQINEGTSILSANITPLSASNKIRGRVFVPVSLSAGGAVWASVAVFRGTQANAIAAATLVVGTLGWGYILSLEFEDSPGALTQQTYSVRVGTNVAANTIVVNSNTPAGGNLLGAAQGAVITLEEIKG
jgi:hypothetical protein